MHIPAHHEHPFPVQREHPFSNRSSSPEYAVGSSYDGNDDQTDRFLKEGIWQNGYQDKYLHLVRSMQPGDNIAIKSSYTRKRELPFDSRGQAVSVMGIKAVGVVTRNHGDGRFVDTSKCYEPSMILRITASPWGELQKRWVLQTLMLRISNMEPWRV